MPPIDSEQARWFAEQVQPHEPALRAYIRGRFPTIADMDDLVQETYARIFRARLAGPISEARPYLFATARNAAFDLFRRGAIISTSPLAEIDPRTVVEDRPGIADAVCHDQELDLLREAIAALPQRCREILVLRKLQGMSHRDIARRLELSENTVNAQIALGVLRCRAYLQSRGMLNSGSR
jgi:RNA polymerase sigma factor (sigma-70 family)